MSRHARDGGRIEHAAAADRHDRRELPDNEPVPGQQKCWLWKLQPRKRLRTRSKLFRAMEHDLCHRLHRIGMEVDSRPMPQSARS